MPPTDPNCPTPPPDTTYQRFSFFAQKINANNDTLVTWNENDQNGTPRTWRAIVSGLDFEIPTISLLVWSGLVDTNPQSTDPTTKYYLSVDHWSCVYNPGSLPPTTPGYNQTTLNRLINAYGWITAHPNPVSQTTAVTTPPGPKEFFRVQVCFLDSDGDGLYDNEEFDCNTNPFLADSDGDGASDYEEVLGNGDPCDYLNLPFDAAHPPQFANLWVDDDNFVLPSGVARDGSRDYPFQEITHAILAARPGDLIAVRAGTYHWSNTASPGNVTQITKALRIVGVDGPTMTHISMFSDGGTSITISNPNSLLYNHDPEPTWSHTGDPIKPDHVPGPLPMSVEFHGLHFYEGFKAPAFFVVPETRLVLAHCYLNSLICGVAECHSAELVMLNCQVAENGDFPRHSGALGSPPGVVYLRGHSVADIWQTTFVDNMKEAGHGTLRAADSARLILRNSVVWETDALYLSVADRTDTRRKFGIEVAAPAEGNLTPASADVQSSLILDTDNPETPYPSPSGGVPNLPSYSSLAESDPAYFTNNPYFSFFIPNTENKVADLRTRRIGYAGNVPSWVADGVRAASLDPSTGLVGPLGYRRHLKYDLEGRARPKVYHQGSLSDRTYSYTDLSLNYGPNHPTSADLGAVETIPTLRDVANEVQPTWTDAAIISAGSGGAVRLALPLSDPGSGRSAGRVISMDSATGRTTGEQHDLILDGLNGDTTVQAVCYGPGASMLYGFGDQRRGGRHRAAGEFAASSLVSSNRGCLENATDPISAILQADHSEPALRGCFASIPASSAPASPTLRINEEPDLEGFLIDGDLLKSPYIHQPATGLRAAVRQQLITIANGSGAGTGRHCLKADNGYPDGVLIAFNTIPRFGKPLDGHVYSLNSVLPYDGGGNTLDDPANPGTSTRTPITAQGIVVHTQAGSSATEQRVAITPPAHGSDYSQTLYYRAWPYSGNGSSRTYGPPLDATIKNEFPFGQLSLSSDANRFPLVINEVMSGTSGWVEVFNTWGEDIQPSDNILQGVELVAHSGLDLPSAVTIKAVLSTATSAFPARSLKVFAIVPGMTEEPVTLESGSTKLINPASRVRFTGPSEMNYDVFRGKARLSGAVSMGRTWDGGPRGFQPVESDIPDDGAAFLGVGTATGQPSEIINPAHPVTRGSSNTANYTDSNTGNICQPYFQAAMKQDLSTVWLAWRNIGNLGCTFEEDGLRHDFCGCRLEGAATQGTTVAMGLRTPLTQRAKGHAVVVNVDVTKITDATTASAWGALTGTTFKELDLHDQGIRAMHWSYILAASDGLSGGEYLIISGPPTTDVTVDHPMTGHFALWSWAGGTSTPVLRIPDLAPYCRFPTGVSTFLIPGSSSANPQRVRIAFSEGRTSTPSGAEQEHIIHWPVGILSPLPAP